MKTAEYLIAKKNSKLFIKIIGAARYTNSSEFGNFVLNDLLKAPHDEEIMLDLTETEFMDSTVMGLIARLAGYSISKFNTKLIVKSPNKDINDLLYNTGFQDYMLIIDDFCEDEADYNKIRNIEKSKSLQDVMLDAHIALSEMNEINMKEFKTVVEMLSAPVED